MSDKIGVLGEATTATVGVTTAYQCPSGKAAKVKLMYHGVAGVNSTLEVRVNGQMVFKTAALTSGQSSFSTNTASHVAGATTSIVGAAAATTVAPSPYEYYLAAGDTIVYEIATAAFSSMNFQVVGTEVDVE